MNSFRHNQNDLLLQQGLKKFNQNKKNEALVIFKKIIENDSNNIKANHAIGVVLGASGDHIEALNYFKKAVQIDNQFKPALFNLAISYYETKQFDRAISVYKDLLKLNPKDTSVLVNLGNCYYGLSDDQSAKNFYYKAVEIDKLQFESLLNLGVIKKKEKNFEKSIEYLIKAQNIKKNDELVLKHLSDAYYQNKEFETAIFYLNKILDLNPNNQDILCVKVCAYFEKDEQIKGDDLMRELINKTHEKEKKEKYYSKVAGVIIRANNNDTDKDFSFCEKYANEAIKINPNNHETFSYRAVAKYFLNDYKGSLQDAEKAISIKPKARITLANLSTLYQLIGNYKMSEVMTREFFETFPEDKTKNFQMCHVSFAQNNFKKGWEYYESRWFKAQGASQDKAKPAFEKPLWNPNLGFDSILVWAEQGIGDQMLHGSMLEDFSKKFKKTHLAIDPRLVKIFQDTHPNINVFSLFDTIDQEFFDYQIPLTSIGAYCRTSIKDFLPLENPYKILGSNKEANNKKLKCAISWKSRNGKHSKLKSASLVDLMEILTIDQIDFYNIQYTDETEEILQAQQNHDINIINPPDLDVKNDIEGLLNFINSCDFVISTSNTNAHLSGSIGKQTFLLLPVAAGRFWYWENEYEGKNVWYPSVIPFKQKTPYKWDDVVNQLHQKIRMEFNL